MLSLYHLFSYVPMSSCICHGFFVYSPLHVCIFAKKKKKILSCVHDFSVDLFTVSVLFQNGHMWCSLGLFLLLTVVKLQAQKCVTTPAFNKQGRADRFCFSPTACQKAIACRKGWNASRWHGADMHSKDNFPPTKEDPIRMCVERSFNLTPTDT